MLKYIFMDVNPYIIDTTNLYKITNTRLLEDQELVSVIGLDNLSAQLDKFQDPINNENQIIDILGKDNCQLLTQKFTQIFNKTLKEIVDNNFINENLIKFFNDASESNTIIVLVTTNKLLYGINIMYSFPSSVVVEVIPSNTHLVASSLVEYASKNNATFDEIACITQVEDTIIDLQKNNIFIVTIKNEDDLIDDKVLTINTIDDLDYSNIVYNFSSQNENDSDI